METLSYTQIKSIISENSSECNYRFTVEYLDGKKEEKRLFVSTMGDICEFITRSRRRGYYFNTGNIVSLTPKIKTNTDGAIMVRKNAEKAVKLLEQSGLWAELKTKFESITKLDNDDICNLLDIHDKWKKARYEHYKEIHKEYDEYFTSRNLTPFDFYHFAQLSKTGQIVSIPYDKYVREDDREMVARAIQQAKDSADGVRTDTLRRCWHGNYDYSVEVSKCEDNQVRAWYSAEFKGCGNGHYYLALDERHAWYYEDD